MLARKALALQPEHPGVLDTMGWAWYHKGNYKQALPLLQMALKSLPDEPAVNFHLGMVLYKVGRYPEARNSLQEAVENKADFPGRDEALEVLNKLS